MKILHVCLSGYYSEGWGYQDNLMTEQNIQNGYEVHVIASRFHRSIDNKIVKNPNNSYIDKYGVYIHRLDFKFPYLGKFNNNVRIYRGLLKTMQFIKPDIIFVHGLQFLDINTIAKYAKRNHITKIYADNHAMHSNSAKSIISKYILHRIIYKYFINRNAVIFKKIFYINESSKKFLISEYKIKKNIEFFPLCGKTISVNSREIKRQTMRKKLGLSESDIVFIHAGKLNKEKKTLELIKTFNELESLAYLVIVGSVDDAISFNFYKEIKKNNSIYYVGWKNSDELIDYLCCGDVLVQPGSQSILFQQAISCGLALILDKNEDTEKLVKYNNGLLLSKIEELRESLLFFLNEKNILVEYKKKSYLLATKELNYDVISKKYLD